MKPFFLKKEKLWLGVLLAGVLMVAVGVFQLFSEFFMTVDSLRGGTPGVEVRDYEAAGDISKAGAPGGKPAEKNNSDDKPSGGEETNRQAKSNKFFVEYRLERDRTRSQQIDLLREIVNNHNSPEETRKEAQRRLLGITQSIDMETKLENLIRAENFKDAVVFIQEKSTTIIVQTPVLTPVDKEKLTELAVRVTGQSAENVVIIPKV